jgi:hypothetical protein
MSSEGGFKIPALNKEQTLVIQAAAWSLHLLSYLSSYVLYICNDFLNFYSHHKRQ